VKLAIPPAITAHRKPAILGPSMDRLKRTHRFDLQLRRLFGFEERSALANVDALVSVTNLTDNTIFDQCGLPQPGRTFRIQLLLF